MVEPRASAGAYRGGSLVAAPLTDIASVSDRINLPLLWQRS